MQPLDQLLHRIRWDAGFGTAAFSLGYYDRFARAEQIVPFVSTIIDAQSGTFSFADDDAAVRRIPLHRVRTVYKDGVAIWHRPGRSVESRARKA